MIAGLEVAQEQLEPRRIVGGGLFPRAAVFRDVGRGHAEIVGLHLAVAGEFFAGAGGVDAGEEAALRVAGLHVGIDLLRELVADGVRDLDAVDRLTVNFVGLAADVVTHASLGEEVALVGGVDEHGRGKRAAALHHDAHDARAVFDHAFARREVEALAADDRDLRAGFAEHVVVDLRRDVRLEGPHGLLVGAGGFVAAVEVVGARLARPRGGILVVLPDAAVEFASEAADGAFVADVGSTEAAGGETAEKLCGLDEDGGLAHARGLERGGDTAGGAAIDDDIGRGGRGGGKGARHEGTRDEQSEGDATG